MSQSGSLPLWLEKAIETLIQSYPVADLQQAYADLSLRYRSQPGTSGYQSKLETLAYIAARLPATYAVVKRCLSELPKDFDPSTILDLGAGPGTASLACLDTYTPHAIDLIEQDQTIINWGQKLFADAPKNNTKISYHRKDLEDVISETSSSTQYDLVIASYVFGELTKDTQWDLFHRIIKPAKNYSLIILPGTPAGFNILRELRERALEEKITIVAPCTHQKACPLKDNDWCHFPVRLPRSSWHKRLKGGDLGYEDEKFCYLLLSKEFVTSTYTGRVIKHPHHSSGHGTVDLCTDGALTPLLYSRKKSPQYQTLKRLNWGDGVKI